MKKSLFSLVSAAIVGVAALWASPNIAQFADQQSSLSLRDSFPIGDNGLCEAQIQAPEPGAGLFDRRYAVLCRDAAAPVGTLWAVRGRVASEAETRFGGPKASCSPSDLQASPKGLSDVRALMCSREGSIVRRQLVVGETGNRTYAASGLSAYRSALELGIASLASDRIVAGTVDIPLTQTTDAVAFARQQAEAIAPDQALAEAYRRSNSGEFAEAAEFFAASAEILSGNNALDARLNEALLQSNLGNYAEAARLFEETRNGSSADPVLARLQRNYETINALNQGESEMALDLANSPLPNDFEARAELGELRIGEAMANRLSAEGDRAAGSAYALSLTPLERAQLLDGQAHFLRATALRLQGRIDEALSWLRSANSTLAEVREGRVISILWLRAQVLGEIAEIAERQGRVSEAEDLHRQGIALLQATYPGSPALQSARGLLAGLYARNGREDEALTLYREIIADAEGRPLTAIRSLMTPYFKLLLATEDEARIAAEMLAASQLLQRPGLAQTQAVLARELSGGSDEASQLFRRTTNLARSIEQLRVGILQLKANAESNSQVAALVAEREQRLEQLLSQQAEILDQLAQYPRYRAVSGGAVALPELQAILRPGEAYVKLVALNEDTFVIFATADSARAYRASLSPDDLDYLVARLRESIAIAEDGQVMTFPFDLEGARELYVGLFGPIADSLPQNRHIVFEPDGAMLKLPVNLLVTDDASVERYKEQLARDDGDEYDFTGTAWLGRSSEISTSVSPAAFRDVRASRPSGGSRAYLGLGQNVPIGESRATSSRTRSAIAGGSDCLWSPDIWANPIKADELYDAAERLGSSSLVLTRADFTDSEIRSREDLTDYRILHFATHGLVTAPQPECPPRPALLTSFGEGQSDGLLSFAEIFGLRIDADLVILSACDTAGSATVGATREAGVTSGGDYALDGLVRAFVGAGGRTVLASHWPVPDDYNATERLISGLFDQSDFEIAEALRRSQIGLMDDPKTSHPFYWSAFAVVGDGAVKATR
ncbi:CHAT domain-containing tetratricopeptide repeat protein [Erythrobacter sp. THAF29]|uniref:CHAT domain-containing protein n=1 Tax=Erythrobacter sp. THAF29 TaxID=2587851 RepID=UPI001267BCFC|nr:CHAT domain-containing tetratricopeptide repeat protein [Erythrobacter sp. THAF29]QFT78684.1 CHAT domain protein [Erythrobacter sp. THAF29]